LGFLSVQGDIWQNENRFVPVHKRSIGYVFQEPSLFPHLSARGNLAYALKRREKRGLALDIDFDEVVSLLELGSLLGRMPEALSGGERQRVAIARALLVGPKLLLMDEPLASLDRARKHEILPYLDRLKEELMLPILYVSHSVEEVQRLADHLVVLEEGRCVYNGPFMKGLIHSEFPLSSERLRLIEPS
jgi:molybdate transport system ATP-binding protein